MLAARDRKLDDLVEPFRSSVFELLARFTEANIQILIVETWRSQAQHEEDVASGHSWVKHSKHQDGLAIDICPYEIYQLYGPDKLDWNADDEIWQRIGVIGENLNLIWGGRWTQRDMGHFEMKGLSNAIV